MKPDQFNRILLVIAIALLLVFIMLVGFDIAAHIVA